MSCASAWQEGNVGLILKGAPVPVNAWNATWEMRKTRKISLRRQALFQSQMTRLGA
jgi:hypothetical protein